MLLVVRLEVTDAHRRFCFIQHPIVIGANCFLSGVTNTLLELQVTIDRLVCPFHLLLIFSLLPGCGPLSRTHRTRRHRCARDQGYHGNGSEMLPLGRVRGLWNQRPSHRTDYILSTQTVFVKLLCMDDDRRVKGQRVPPSATDHGASSSREQKYCHLNCGPQLYVPPPLFPSLLLGVSHFAHILLPSCLLLRPLISHYSH